MSQTIKRGKRPTPRRKVARPPVADRLLAALPVSEAAIRRGITTGIVGAVAIGGWFALSLFGIPGLVGSAAAEAAGRAGFRVEQIEITGLKRMDRMSVYAIATNQQSRAMPSVDLDAVREKLLQYGWIEDAQVSRRLPDTLLVHIVERKPAAVWQANGKLTLIDAGGVLLEPVSATAMPDLPLVIGRGANLQEPNYQNIMAAAPALKPLVRAATWVGNRRWDLLFTTGETLMLPQGEERATRALVKFAEMDGTDRLLGKNWTRFDMRIDGQLVARGDGRELNKSTKVAPAKKVDEADDGEQAARDGAAREA